MGNFGEGSLEPEGALFPVKGLKDPIYKPGLLVCCKCSEPIGGQVSWGTEKAFQ